MKPEYDFSNAERGKFYRPNARLNLPVYLVLLTSFHDIVGE